MDEMTSVAEMRAAKKELEKALYDLFVAFAAKTGLHVESVLIDTVERHDGTVIVSNVEVEATL